MPHSGDRAAVVVESSGWAYDPALQRWAAEVVRSKQADGQVVHVWRRGRVGTVDPRQFAAMTRVPEPDGTDPVRGTFTFIEDHRAARRQITALTDAGPVVTAMPADPGTRDTIWIRQAGWAVAACLAATLVLLRLRAIVLRRSDTSPEGAAHG